MALQTTRRCVLMDGGDQSGRYGGKRVGRHRSCRDAAALDLLSSSLHPGLVVHVNLGMMVVQLVGGGERPHHSRDVTARSFGEGRECI
ncbi:hypothetical protein F2Q70_00024920 [Brassica cretica]|uniref:Uncharacterized protein n=1 Tax=Brassica cretica TaxID=69181 RepID=A0A3N6S5D5_BRACR|nr:hypothetical protein F2Q70_00024920 [Brassica cretica]KAF3580540.1 hypothetical protein DY000_02029173 [Brassica cretica]